MNRFRIALGREEVFENIWRERDSHLDKVSGFKEFHLLRGPIPRNSVGPVFNRSRRSTPKAWETRLEKTLWDR